MELGAVHDIIEDLQLSKINDNSTNSVLIEIYWIKEYAVVKNNDENNTSCESRLFCVQHDFYSSKKEFINDLIGNIIKFALLNIEMAICVCDMELPKGDQKIYETKSCQTFCEKVCDFTGLNKLQMLQVLLPHFEAELYFYILPQENRLKENLIIARNAFNTAAVNSLIIKLISECDKDDISFIGKVGIEGHRSLKKFVDQAVNKVLVHLNNNILKDGSNFEDDEKSNKVVDLTATEEDQHENDEIFYDFNTSNVMEVDDPLDSYYNEDFKCLNDGWDVQVDMKKYISSAYDKLLMEQYLKDVVKSSECQMVSDDLEIIETDDEPQLISIDNSRKRKTMFEPRTSRENSSKFNRIQLNRTIVPMVSRTEHLSDLPKRAATSKNLTKKPIKSNLFNQEEVNKWQKAEKCNMSDILSTGLKDYKDFDNHFRIPKKICSSPKARRPIHGEKDDDKKQKLSENNIHHFDRQIGNLVPYNSPLVHRNTPESVSKFVSSDDKCVVIDDDDDDNNNNKGCENNQNATGIRRRKLLNISEEDSKRIFKNRKQGASLKFSPFVSGRNSSYHRKT